MKYFEVEQELKRLKIVFSSEINKLEKIVGEAVKFLQEHDVDVDLFGFRLSLYEGFSNAVKHGNSFNPELTVSFEMRIKPDVILIKVADQGDGFDWQDILNRKKGDIMSPDGRGLMLIRAYGYVPEYNQKGNELTLTKKLK